MYVNDAVEDNLHLQHLVDALIQSNLKISRLYNWADEG